MINYKKPNYLITLLKSKHDFLTAYSRELYKANRYNYPLSSLNIIVPEKISNQKIKKFIIDSFRESDIVYYSNSSRYIQVLLPYTPTEHLDIIINRLTKTYNSIKKIDANELLCEIVNLTQDRANDINTLICALDKAEYMTKDNYDTGRSFNAISNKLLNILEKENIELNFINNYCGLKVNYKAILISKHKSYYTFETDPMQLAAIKNSSETLIEIKKYGFHVNASLESIDFVLNRVVLTNLTVMPYNNIFPSTLTIELKETLNAQLISLGSNANIQLSAISFNEIHGHGDISQLVIDNNTLRLLIHKDLDKHTLLVKFIYSKFDGKSQNFILRIMDDSEKSLKIFKTIVTKRSRECIQELKQSIA